MRNSGQILAFALAGAMAVVVSGCGEHDDHAGHDHGKGHAHTAPHGGTLVELGAHQGNVEFVRDAAGGKLTAYILDAHAENFVRVPLDAFTLRATVGGKEETLTFKPVGNTVTGEKPGDTSQFEAAADWLKTATTFDAVLPQLPIKGTTFTEVKFNFPKGSE
jgi:hypothetical protein